METTLKNLKWSMARSLLIDDYFKLIFRPIVEELYELNCRDSVMRWVELYCPEFSNDMFFKPKDHLNTIRDRPVWSIFTKLKKLVKDIHPTLWDVQFAIVNNQTLSKLFKIDTNLLPLEIKSQLPDVNIIPQMLTKEDAIILLTVSKYQSFDI